MLSHEVNSSDGIRIHDLQTERCLRAKGLAVNPAVHPEFLTFGDRYQLNVTSLCAQGTSELVPRHSNRMVVIRPHQPFSFSTSASRGGSGSSASLETGEEKRGGGFERDTMIALIFTLSHT